MKFKEMYEALLEFPEGWRGVRKISLLCGRSDLPTEPPSHANLEVLKKSPEKPGD